MSVTVRRYKRGGWHVDIRLTLPDGKPYRERRRINVPSKSAAKTWGHERERHVLQHGLPQPRKEVPTLQEFKDRFLEGHTVAERVELKEVRWWTRRESNP